MMSELFQVLRRSRSTILQDLLGAAALILLLVSSLYLPAFA